MSTFKFISLEKDNKEAVAEPILVSFPQNVAESVQNLDYTMYHVKD